MKKNLHLLGLVIVFLACSQFMAAQSKTETELRQTTSVKLEMNSPEIKSIFGNKSFFETLKILVANGEKLDIKTAKKTTFVNKPTERKEKISNKQYEISFDVLTEDGKAFGEYKKLVYLFDGKNTVIYFDEQNSEPIEFTTMILTEKWIDELPLSKKQKDKLKDERTDKSFCFKWNSWQTIRSNYCDYNYFCVGKNQRATYRDEKRTCKKNSNHSQTRKVKLNCGC